MAGQSLLVTTCVGHFDYIDPPSHAASIGPRKPLKIIRAPILDDNRFASLHALLCMPVG